MTHRGMMVLQQQGSTIVVQQNGRQYAYIMQPSAGYQYKQPAQPGVDNLPAQVAQSVTGQGQQLYSTHALSNQHTFAVKPVSNPVFPLYLMNGNQLLLNQLQLPHGNQIQSPNTLQPVLINNQGTPSIQTLSKTQSQTHHNIFPRYFVHPQFGNQQLPVQLQSLYKHTTGSLTTDAQPQFTVHKVARSASMYVQSTPRCGTQVTAATGSCRPPFSNYLGTRTDSLGTQHNHFSHQLHSEQQSLLETLYHHARPSNTTLSQKNVAYNNGSVYSSADRRTQQQRGSRWKSPTWHYTDSTNSLRNITSLSVSPNSDGSNPPRVTFRQNETIRSHPTDTLRIFPEISPAQPSEFAKNSDGPVNSSNWESDVDFVHVQNVDDDENHSSMIGNTRSRILSENTNLSNVNDYTSLQSFNRNVSSPDAPRIVVSMASNNKYDNPSIAISDCNMLQFGDNNDPSTTNDTSELSDFCETIDLPNTPRHVESDPTNPLNDDNLPSENIELPNICENFDLPSICENIDLPNTNQSGLITPPVTPVDLVSSSMSLAASLSGFEQHFEPRPFKPASQQTHQLPTVNVASSQPDSVSEDSLHTLQPQHLVESVRTDMCHSVSERPTGLWLSIDRKRYRSHGSSLNVETKRKRHIEETVPHGQRHSKNKCSKKWENNDCLVGRPVFNNESMVLLNKGENIPIGKLLAFTRKRTRSAGIHPPDLMVSIPLKLLSGEGTCRSDIRSDKKAPGLDPSKSRRSKFLCTSRRLLSLQDIEKRWLIKLMTGNP